MAKKIAKKNKTMVIKKSILYNILVKRASESRKPSVSQWKPTLYRISKLLPCGYLLNKFVLKVLGNLLKTILRINNSRFYDNFYSVNCKMLPVFDKLCGYSFGIEIILFIFLNSGSMRQGDHFSQTKTKSEKPVIDIIDFK